MEQKQEKEAGARTFDEAREFFDKRDGGTKVFEIEWTKKVVWLVFAASKEEAEKAAGECNTNDLDFDPPEIFVSLDQVEQAKKHAERFNREVKPPDADSGVFEGEIIHVNEYLAQRVWYLICEAAGNSITCEVCGHEDWTSEFNRNPNPPRYGHVPILGCPECKQQFDWIEFLSKREVRDEKTLSLFEEEGEADGAAE